MAHVHLKAPTLTGATDAITPSASLPMFRNGRASRLRRAPPTFHLLRLQTPTSHLRKRPHLPLSFRILMLHRRQRHPHHIIRHHRPSFKCNPTPRHPLILTCIRLRRIQLLRNRNLTHNHSHNHIPSHNNHITTMERIPRPIKDTKVVHLSLTTLILATPLRLGTPPGPTHILRGIIRDTPRNHNTSTTSTTKTPRCTGRAANMTVVMVTTRHDLWDYIDLSINGCSPDLFLSRHPFPFLSSCCLYPAVFSTYHNQPFLLDFDVLSSVSTSIKYIPPSASISVRSSSHAFPFLYYPLSARD